MVDEAMVKVYTDFPLVKLVPVNEQPDPCQAPTVPTLLALMVAPSCASTSR